MPKAKPSHVIVHRIELQETERAALEAALAGRFVTNAVSAAGSVFSGIGTMLVPFSGALTAIAGLWIADKGIDAVIDSVKQAKEDVEQVIEWYSPSKQQEAYEYICAYLRACDGWDGNPNSMAQRIGQLVKDLEKMQAHPFLIIKLKNFVKYVKGNQIKTGNYPSHSPAKAWTAFYSPQQYLADVKATVPGF